jgi:hypothetical protein
MKNIFQPNRNKLNKSLTFEDLHLESELENPMTSTTKKSWMDCPQGFACQIRSVILTHIILTVSETLEGFLSNTTMHTHILASGPE